MLRLRDTSAWTFFDIQQPHFRIDQVFSHHEVLRFAMFPLVPVSTQLSIDSFKHDINRP